MATTTIDIRRAQERFHTSLDWLESYHSFSFGEHYDPTNTHHGVLRVNNDDVIQPGTGFGTHAHAHMEIVTWVLSGELEHRDSTGRHGVIYPGLVQRMSAGTGIQHSEVNPSRDEAVRLVQMWVIPDTKQVSPSYEQADMSNRLNKGGLVPVASGQGHEGAVFIHQRGAVLWIGRLRVGERAEVPEAPFVHVFVATGAVELEGSGRLVQGDAARLTQAGGRETLLGKSDSSELMIWEMDGDIIRKR